MSAMILDKSLDTIIAEKKDNRRKSGPRRSNPNSAKAKLVGKGGLPAVQAKRRAVAAAAAPAPAPVPITSNSTAMKIIVSNLPQDVTDVQIKELFNTTVGPTKACNLQYNAQGKSSGHATVIFRDAGSAQKAFDQYNNRLIDGKRAMRIEIVVDPAKQPLVNRVAAPKPAAKPSTVAAAGSGGAPRGAVAGRRGRGRGRGGASGAGGSTRRPKKTAEDLDAEMADYTKGGNAAATTA